MGEPCKVYKLWIEGRDKYITCLEGETLNQALVSAGVYLEANCSGRGVCGTCKVRVLKGQVVGKNGQMIAPEKDNSYLACQTYPKSDITLGLNQLEVSAKGDIALTHKEEGRPLLKKMVLSLAYPTIDNHYSLQEMVEKALKSKQEEMGESIKLDMLYDTKMLRHMATVMESNPQEITVVFFANEALAIESGNTGNVLYGVAFDIGTTTVVGMLVDMIQQKVIAIESETNPQTAFGADVISRIQVAHASSAGLKEEAQMIRQCLNRIIEKLCSAAHIVASSIYAAALAGNSTMNHLLLEITPSSLVRKPYAALFKHVAPLCAPQIELGIHPNARVIILPNIASFVGSDTTAAVLAVEQEMLEMSTILVDLGTNGEMVLAYGNEMYACSTAAGPAFEGAHIRDGMRAASGAIADVGIDEDVWVKVIGESKPSGICGSGIVKAVAELVKAKIIDSTGRFKRCKDAAASTKLEQRLKKQGSQWEFVLVEGKDSATGFDISITQSDIRQIQLVKSSICTGIQFLLEKIPSEESVQICLAGAFGNYVDIDSAVTIGMFRGVKRKMIKPVGNAAGIGAMQSLLSVEKLQRCADIANSVVYVELASQTNFSKKIHGKSFV